MKRKNETSENEISKCCAYCEKATVLASEDYVLCSKRGVVSQTYSCRRFSYDPLKKVPRRMPDMPTLDDVASEFPDI